MNIKQITALRHHLHARPEVSNSELETARIIKDFIARYHPTRILEGIGGAGIAAVYEYPKPGKTITIRCELDALPIQEENQMDYQSIHAGVSHKCGHDGHMAIVASLATWLQKNELEKGKVVLLFQPAEENGEGAAQILRDQLFKSLETDYVFALHNIPKEPMHSILIMESGFSAEVQSLIIKLHGKESHAAEPENGKNPAECISKLIQSISELNENDPTNDSFAVLTPVHILMGQKSYGISPGSGELHYTIRTWSTEKMEQLKSNIVEILKQTSHIHGLDYEIDWLEYFPASTNDTESNTLVRNAALENKFHIIERPYPFTFGEDFGWYSKSYKTAMFGLGAGLQTPALHHSDYDFPDELLPTGFLMFTSIVSAVLRES